MGMKERGKEEGEGDREGDHGDDGEVMGSSSRRTMWLQCGLANFHLHKADWSSHCYLTV